MIQNSTNFVEGVKNSCRNILSLCKTLLENVMINRCAPHILEEGIQTCKSACCSLRDYVVNFHFNVPKEVILTTENILLGEIDRLLSIFEDMIPHLRTLLKDKDSPTDNIAVSRGEFLEATKKVIGAARKVEEHLLASGNNSTTTNPNAIPQIDKIQAKQLVLEHLEVVASSAERQDQQSWRRSAKLLANYTNIVVESLKNKSVIVQYVVLLVKESQAWFTSSTPGSKESLRVIKEKVFDLINSIDNPIDDETVNAQLLEFQRFVSQHKAQRQAQQPADTHQNTNNTQSANVINRTDDTDTEEGSESYTSSESYATSNRPNEAIETSDDERSKRRMKEGLTKTHASLNPPWKMNGGLDPAEVGNQLIKLIQEVLPVSWNALNKTQQELLLKELLESADLGSINQSSSSSTSNNNGGISGGVNKVGLSLPTLTEINDPKGKGKSRTQSLASHPEEEFGVTPMNTARFGRSLTEAEDAHNNNNKSKLTMTNKAQKSYKSKLFTLKPNKKTDVQPVALITESPRTIQISRLKNIVSNTLSEISSFIEEHRSVVIPYLQDEKEKSIPQFPNVESKKIVIFQLIDQIISFLKEVIKNIPYDDTPLMEGQDEPIFRKVLNRVKKEINEPLKPQVLQLDHTITQNFHIYLMRKNMLGSIQFRTNRLYYAISQYLANLWTCSDGDTNGYLQILALSTCVYKNLTNLVDYFETFQEIISIEKLNCENYVKQKKSSSSSDKKSKKQKFKDTIWKEEPYKDTDTSDRFRPGTLNNLIIRLTAGATERIFLNAFLNGYPSFSSPQELFHKLKDRYNVPKNTLSEGDDNFLRLRVSNVLLHWIKRDFHYLDLDLVHDIKQFCSKTTIKDSVKLIEAELKDDARFSFKEPSSIPKDIVIFNTGSPAYYILWQHEEQLIAEQMTYIELEIFRRIDSFELVGLRWTKANYKVLTQNVQFLIDRVDRLSYWVATFILFHHRFKDRAKAIMKMINIARCLFELNNFNSFMGVILGLGMVSISRLSFSWELIPEKIMRTFKQLEEVANPMSGFKSLREAIKSAGKSLPYLATYLKDLTAMAENQDFVTRDDHTLINLNKHYLITNTIADLLQYQKTMQLRDDVIPVNPIYTFLNELPALDDKELASLSLERQPRNVELKFLLEREKES
eukprot:TRINITY_DN1494_c2_g1_i3.p1 TRINITY_DN1494_c2_g1~~TRINITY_DN1494_c2_g1_i3.p1  ORF type:complete len:1149 (-),score=288.00 TRINITY_DN1494_c2_g1_i3:222-3668(-)